MDIQTIVIVIFSILPIGIVLLFSFDYRNKLSKLQKYLIDKKPIIWSELEKTGEDKIFVFAEMAGAPSAPLHRQIKVLKKLEATDEKDSQLVRLCRDARKVLSEGILLIVIVSILVLILFTVYTIYTFLL